MQLSEYLERFSVSPAAVATLAKVDPHVIHKCIDGHHPKVSTADKISRATDGLVTVQELLGLPLCHCQKLDNALKAIQAQGVAA